MVELHKAGHKVYAVCPKGEYFKEFEKLGIKAIEYKIERGSTNPLKELVALKNIYQVLKPLDVEILHCFTIKPNIYGSLVGKILKIPTIINSVTGLGSFYIQESFKAKIFRFLIENLYKLSFIIAKKVLFQNSEDLELYVKKGLVRKEKTALIRGSGIDMESFAPNKDKNYENLVRATSCEGTPPKSPFWTCSKRSSVEVVVLMIARAIWDKGVREYYEAAEILKEKNIRFLYVGDVDSGNITSVNLAFMKNGNVEYLGHRDDIKDLMDSCDIFVLPSYREGLPRTLLEASSMKKAIVTTDTTGCREVVENGKNGYLVPIKDAKALAEKIEMLANDETLRERFGEAAYNKCKNEFDVKIVVKKYLELYGGI